MLKRYRAWRNRLTSEVVVAGGQPWRITRQRGKIIGIETWITSEHHDPVYEYMIWRAA